MKAKREAAVLQHRPFQREPRGVPPHAAKCPRPYRPAWRHIRRVPTSGAFPRSTTRPRLAEALAAFQVSYEHMAALDRLRGNPSSSCAGYQRLPEEQKLRMTMPAYALSEEFHARLEPCSDEGAADNGADATIRDSEAVWWRCRSRSPPIVVVARGAVASRIWGGAARSPPALLRAPSFDPAERSAIPRPADSALTKGHVVSVDSPPGGAIGAGAGARGAARRAGRARPRRSGRDRRRRAGG